MPFIMDVTEYEQINDRYRQSGFLGNVYLDSTLN